MAKSTPDGAARSPLRTGFSADRRTLVLGGHGESADAESLATTVRAWHAELLRENATAVLVCLWHLDALHPRAAESVFQWLRLLAGVARPYRVTLVGHSERPWQQACLRAMGATAPKQVSVRFDAVPYSST